MAKTPCLHSFRQVRPIGSGYCEMEARIQGWNQHNRALRIQMRTSRIEHQSGIGRDGHDQAGEFGTGSGDRSLLPRRRAAGVDTLQSARLASDGDAREEEGETGSTRKSQVASWPGAGLGGFAVKRGIDAQPGKQREQPGARLGRKQCPARQQQRSCQPGADQVNR